MGLFGSSKKTVVGTAVLRAVQDENIPDTLRQSLIQAVIKDRPISDTFLENILNGGALQVEAMYRYAEDNYHYGLPKATTLSNQAGFGKAEEIIASEVGYPITVRYMDFLPLSNTHVGWKTLTDDYGYDHASNEITSLSASTGFPVYLEDLVAVHTQALVDEAEGGALQNLGPVGRSGFTPQRVTSGSPTGRGSTNDQPNVSMPTVYEIGTEEGVRIETVHKDDTETLVRDSVFVSLAGYNLEPEYYQCGYSYLDASNNEIHGYWTYEFNAGTYPELDAAFDADETAIGTYFPFVFFRNKKQDLTADTEKDTAAYKTSDQLLGHLGMDYGEVGAEINNNPDIGDVEQAYMMMGISMNSTHQADLHYLYEYFDRLGNQSLIQDPDAIQPQTGYFFNNGVSNPNALMISDTHSAMRFSYYNITKRLVAGKIGEPGEYGTRTGTKTVTRVVRKPDRNSSTERYENREFTIPQRIYQKQVNTSVYEELSVIQPKMAYDIYKGYSHTAVTGEEQLLIPLDKTITDEFSIVDKETIYARSMHFVFNSRVTEKVKWYETTLFKFVLSVVAIVITVLSLGSAWETLVVAAGVGIGALAMTLVTMIVEAAVYSYAFELVVSELGLENSFLIAILAVVAAFYIGGTNGGIDNAPWAKDLLTASNGLMREVSAESGRRISEYNSKTQAFELMAEEAYAELEEAQDLLEFESLLDPLSFVGLQPQTMPGEEPDDYYQRTIHQGNIGTLGFDAISSYVDYSLKLPELNSTIGDTNDGLQ